MLLRDKWILFITVTALILAGVFSCDMPTEEPSGSTGTLSVLLTDAPFPIDAVDAANVTIDSVVIREKVETGEEEGYPFITLTTEKQEFNLLDLQNGVAASLVDLEVPVGEYDLIRLYVGEASITYDGTEHNLFVPSGAQTGIKIFIDPEIQVEGGLTSELLLDFDVSRSFIVRGNPNSPAGIKGFNFKPVVRASNLSTAGRVTGVVTDAVTGDLLEGIEVKAEQDTGSVASALTQEDGSYTMIGLQAAAYILTAVAKADYDSTAIENVNIVAGNVTTVNFELDSLQTATTN